MKSRAITSFGALTERVLGTCLPSRLSNRIDFQALSPDAQQVIHRLLALMKRSACPATELNSHMIWLLASVTPGMLPSAWGGNIPPVTTQGRHKKLDDYIIHTPPVSNLGQPVYIDVGCGFPPVTTIDTSNHLPDWSVFGVDRSFPDYVLYDAEGSYASFSPDGSLHYLQTRSKPLDAHSKATKAHFKSLFDELRPLLSIGDASTSATVEKNGNRLKYNGIRDFEGKNLKFIRSDIDGLALPPADAVRCMNVLLYFEKHTRSILLANIGSLLKANGLLITGFNHPFGIYARYSIYSKDKVGVRPREFTFSLDNLRPLGVGPWLALADEDQEAELLADLTGAIRADRRFWREFNPYVDRLRKTYGICARGKDGFFFFLDGTQDMPSHEMMERTSALWKQLQCEGYTEGAIEALNRAGYDAWKNPVGDIAVIPPVGSLSRI